MNLLAELLVIFTNSISMIMRHESNASCYVHFYLFIFSFEKLFVWLSWVLVVGAGSLVAEW